MRLIIQQIMCAYHIGRLQLHLANMATGHMDGVQIVSEVQSSSCFAEKLKQKS